MKTLLTVLTLAVGGAAAAQTIHIADDATLPRFEVAPVKRSDNSSVNSSYNTAPGQYRVDNVPLVDVVSMGFGVPASRIEAPAWVFRDRFTVAARIPEGAANADRPLMVRALLLDRFKLRYHVTKKDSDGYELRLARSDGQLGPQLRRSTSDCAARRTRNELLASCRYNARPGILEADGIPAAFVATYLGAQLDAVVVDRTGLTGDVDVSLQYSRESLRIGADTQAGQNGPSLFSALQEQLGLRLEGTRLAVDNLVIDAISQPEPD